MSLSEYIIENEKVFKGAHDIKYLFIPASKPSSHLAVTFSGFNGKEQEGKPAFYNYVRYLQEIDCHRLFILDNCMGHPAYYLGQHKKLDYEVSVAALIFKIANENKIRKENIITCGSSKGGTAAFYFAMRYDFGHFIAGGFQFKVGDYLYGVNNYTRDTVLKLITGGNSEGHRDYLNQFYIDIVSNYTYKTKPHIHVGSGDSHYNQHVKPFVKILEEREIPYDLDVQAYKGHSEMGPYFATYLLDELSAITGEIFIKDTSIETESENIISVSCQVPESFIKNKTVHFAYYVYKDGHSGPIEKTKYSNSSTLKYQVTEPGKYTVKVFVKKGETRLSKGTSWVTV
ncbi:hypothetical protein [Priestia flexa]|uniref:hypothetical protein n=1 Tax=Priestia flexa TaxID=86664 RepID=UPI001B32E7C8|nr:hypothetical protein [Priestia flexa]